MESTRAASQLNARKETGITLRHRRACKVREGGGCSCQPSYQAQVWAARERKPLRKSFTTLAEARAWRQEAQVKLRRRQLSAPSKILLRDAAEEWLEAARAGVIRTRSGHPYKPSAIRSYEASLRSCALPQIGHLRLTAIDRNPLQDLADGLVGRGYAPATIRNAILPLRAIYRRAAERGNSGTTSRHAGSIGRSMGRSSKSISNPARPFSLKTVPIGVALVVRMRRLLPP